MERLLTAGVIVCCCTPAFAGGFTFGGAGQDYPYPNEPQYQYPYTYTHARWRSARPCLRGQEPYQGTCRKVIWRPGSFHQ
jgi:hypothetical protein